MNRVVSVDGGTTAQYAYDQNNRRIKKTLGSAVTHYVWEGSQVVSEHDGSGILLVEYIYSGSRMIGKVASGSTQYFVSDRLSVRMTLDASGNVSGRQAHFPFGEDFGESGTQDKHHFTSYERDTETSQDYAINRGYSVGVGRFVSSDPYRASGYLIDPQSWNRYTYTRNNPVNRHDPVGLQDTYVHIPGWDYMNINGSNGMKVDGGSGGGGRYAPFLDTGSEPGRGGTQKPIRRAGDASERLDRFLHDHQDCEQAINAAIEAESPGGVARRDLQELFLDTSFEDWRDHGDQTLFELGLAAAAPDFSDATPLRLVLGTGTMRFLALTNPSTRTVYLGWAFARTRNEARKDQTIVHELLHVAFGNHVEIAKALGLKKDGKDYTDNGEASEAIDDWLDNNCR